MMKAKIGYPEPDAEHEILRVGSQKASIENLAPILDREQVVACQNLVDEGIIASEKIINYILTITYATRKHPMIEIGISTRGAMVLLKCAKCVAWMRGRDYVVPEDVKIFAQDVLTHRLQPSSGSRSDMRAVIEAILEEVPAP